MGLLKKLFRFGNKARRSLNFNFNQVGSDWNPQLLPPDAQIRDTHERLIARCRNIADDDSYGAGIVHVVSGKHRDGKRDSDSEPVR